ncbi:MAG: PKD domain-containing protein, partial [Bacteroidales bacterium]
MKNYILLFLLVFILNEPLYSQNEGNNWYFGNKAGLSFNTDPPTPLTNGQLSTGEGCAAVSDLNGNLLFYTDGIYVYNKMHNVMPNGSGLMGDPSSTQSAIIVPQPGTYNVSLKRFNIYYIFTVDVCGGSDGVRYSIVDMTLDNGLGDITVKNVHLYGTTTTEKICATTHANGCDFWIIGKLRDNNTFYSYLLDNNGLQPPVISNTGPSIGSYHGYMKVSHNSQLIAIAHCGPGEGIHVYDFDNNTGNIILKFSDVPLGSTCYYGIEFSPDDNLLYFTALHSPNIYQYNLNVLDNLAFKSSLTIIGTTSNNPNPYGYILGALQIAKNNKIYAALIGKTSLGVINNPNIQGTGCNYTDFSQDLAGRTCQLGLPTFPSSYLVPLNYILFNDNRCVLEPVSFSLSDSTFINVQWYFYNINNPTIPYATSNDHHPNIIFNNHGSYIIKAVINYPCIIDTILDTISIFENPNISINVSSNNVCLNEGSELIVSSDIPGTTFNWSNGLGTNPNVTVSPTATNTYSVTGTTPEGCTGTAEVTVTVHPLPNITASATPSDICLNENSDLMVSSDIPGTTFSWSNGLGTNPSVTVIPTATTTYLVTGTTPEGCTGTAEVTVTVHPLPNITASATPSDICLNENSDLTVSSDIIGTTFSWSNGLGTNPNVTVSPTATTTYSVTGTTLEGCTGTAEVTVTVHPLPNITASATPSEICLNENSDLMVSSDIPGTTFSWSNGLGTNSNVTVSPTATTTYSVTGTTPEGCTGTAEVTVTVHNLPNIDFLASPLSGCEPLLVSFINNSDNGTYYWYFGDGNSDNMHSPTHIYNNDGFYDIMLIVKNQYNCLDTLIKYNYITVYPSPISGFSISPTITTEVDGYVMIIDNSTGANSWYYDFGDNNNADIFYDREPMYRYTIADNYVITQIVANQYGCSDTSYNQVHVRPFTTYYLPNAFTPNDDGQNDFFNFSATNIEFTNFEMRIFDRWGKQIFFTTNPNLGWDGK